MSDPEVRLAEALVEELPESCGVDRDWLQDWLTDALPAVHTLDPRGEAIDELRGCIASVIAGHTHGNDVTEYDLQVAAGINIMLRAPGMRETVLKAVLL